MKAPFSLASLFSEYSADLRRLISHKFGDVHDAEDIVQDAFHNVLGSKDVHNIDNPRAYLYQSAHNLALNRIRKRRREQAYIEACNDDELGPPLENHVAAERDLQAVQAALHRLPNQCQRAFVLSRVHAKTYAEIAEELGVSVSTVEKYLIRVLRFLRSELEDA